MASRPATPSCSTGWRVHFIRSGWDVKALQKLIVTSADLPPVVTADAGAAGKRPGKPAAGAGAAAAPAGGADPRQALAASGLLVRDVGGPSVKPYQPPGLWEELASSGNVYLQDKGDALYRRSMYTFWKRTVPPPAMTTFDAPSREVCSVSRSRTNTPLQALALLNDTTYVEAARNLAQRAMTEAAPNRDERLATCSGSSWCACPPRTSCGSCVPGLTGIRRIPRRPGERREAGGRR